VLEVLREEGFVRGKIDMDADELLEYLLPLLDPIREHGFQFSRRGCERRRCGLGDPRSPAAALGRQLNLPPSYLLIHRVTMGTSACSASSAGRRLPDRDGALAARLRRPEPGSGGPR
jgi:hypothetical protein